MRIITVCLILIWLNSASFGQGIKPRDIYRQADERAMQVRTWMIYHPDILVDSLTSPFTDDFSKIRAIFTWIATNIEYDLKAFLEQRTDHQDVFEILASGKALCSGFSSLFRYFCDKANIECEIIEGYAKAFGYKPGEKFSSPNHAWNAVYIEGNWYLLDVTWASGTPEYLSGRKRKPDLNTFFLPPPEELIKTHLPEDPSWQLLDRKVTLDEFETGRTIVAETSEANNFSPEDYRRLDAFDRDILKFKRVHDSNPRSAGAVQNLSFAYLYKAISITDGLRLLDTPAFKDTVLVLRDIFYTYLDSARMILEPVEHQTVQKSKKIMADEILYQKGVFNYEVASELLIRSEKSGMLKDSNKSAYMPFFEEAATYFMLVSEQSIYHNDAIRLLGHIAKYRQASRKP